MKLSTAQLRRQYISRTRKYKQHKKKLINRSNQKKFIKAVLLVIVVAISLVFLGLYSFKKYTEKSFASALSTNESYHISQDDTPTVLYIVTDGFNKETMSVIQLDYLIFDKNDNKLITYHIPVTTRVDMPGKFGEEEISKVFTLGNISGQDPSTYAISALQSTVLKLFGFKADSYIIIDPSAKGTFDDIWKNGGNLGFFGTLNLVKYKNSFKTNIAFNDLTNLVTFTKQLSDERMLEKTADTAYLSDTTQVDDDISDVSLDSAISKEGKNVAVLNGTDVPGIATIASRVVNNIGGRVVGIGNAGKTYDQSIIVADEKGSLTVSMLARVFRISKILSKNEALSFNESEIDRSDVTIIFGFDSLEGL